MICSCAYAFHCIKLRPRSLQVVHDSPNSSLIMNISHIPTDRQLERTLQNTLGLRFCSSVPSRTLSPDVSFSRRLYKACWAKHFCQPVAQRCLCGSVLHLVTDFYANEMLMHWRILRFAAKAVQICKTNLFKFTRKETMNINLQIFEARGNVSTLSARPEYVAEGDPSCPPKRVNLWHYWLSDMKRIDESGVVRLWMGTGFCHCERDPFRGTQKCEAALKRSHVLV